jgi:hypothetical protein
MSKIEDKSPTAMAALTTGGSASTTTSHTFTSAGTYYVRACADKTSRSNTGLITESNEGDNCSAWTNVNVVASSSDFVTTWKTNNLSTGSSNNTSITIPTSSEYIYSYQVDWNNDGDYTDANEIVPYTGPATHNFGTAGTYTIRIRGTFPAIYFND